MNDLFSSIKKYGFYNTIADCVEDVLGEYAEALGTNWWADPLARGSIKKWLKELNRRNNQFLKHVLYENLQYEVIYNNDATNVGTVRAGKISRIDNKITITMTKVEERNYCCISHCWSRRMKDNVICIEPKKPKKIDCVIGDLYKMVYDVLVREKKPLHIWCDILSIDQCSYDDKKELIPQMGNIYKNSYCNVCILHGVDIEELKTSIEKLKEWYNDNTSIDKTKELYGTYSNYLSVFMKVIHHDWFNRVWTLQEMVAQKECYIIGDNSDCWINIEQMFDTGLKIRCSVIDKVLNGQRDRGLRGILKRIDVDPYCLDKFIYTKGIIENEYKSNMYRVINNLRKRLGYTLEVDRVYSFYGFFLYLQSDDNKLPTPVYKNNTFHKSFAEIITYLTKSGYYGLLSLGLEKDWLVGFTPNSVDVEDYWVRFDKKCKIDGYLIEITNVEIIFQDKIKKFTLDKLLRCLIDKDIFSDVINDWVLNDWILMGNNLTKLKELLEEDIDIEEKVKKITSNIFGYGLGGAFIDVYNATQKNNATIIMCNEKPYLIFGKFEKETLKSYHIFLYPDNDKKVFFPILCEYKDKENAIKRICGMYRISYDHKILKDGKNCHLVLNGNNWDIN